MPTDTRSNLISTTQRLLWDRGYAATSPRAILDAAGVGQGSMYHHFAGKEALAAAAFAQSAEGVLERARAILAGDADPLSRVVSYLSLPREVLRGCPVGRMAGDAEVLASAELSAVLAETFEQIRSQVIATLQEAYDAGQLAGEVDPHDLADTVLAVVQGGYVLARAADDVQPFDRAVRGAVSLLELSRRTGRAAS